MASPRARKTSTMNRLKKKLNDAKQSLADQFEFKMFVAFVFKDKVRFRGGNHPIHILAVFLQTALQYGNFASCG